MEINFINQPKSKIKSNLELKTNNNNSTITININGITNYDLDEQIKNIEKFLKNKIHVKFNNINEKDIENIILKLHNITYDYIQPRQLIIPNKYNHIVNELNDYKTIVIEPNKYQETMLKYFKSKIPTNYTYKKFNVKRNDKMFPLTAAVNQGSSHKSYFIHVFPKKLNKSWDDIFLIGKCVTFDSGGMNIKIRDMQEMKVDMAGSAIIMGVLNMTHNLQKNINLLIPIVENYIGSDATRPSTVVKTLNNKKVEIVDTDAEGRLCIADAIEYFNKFLYSKKLKNPLLIDVATLTGNVYQISCSTSAIVTGNQKAKKYISKLFQVGEETKEFIDVLILRENYVKSLVSQVADIKNWDGKCRAGCLTAASFIDFFVKKDIPWVHLDVASVVYNNERVSSYGINLLSKFLEQI